MGGTFDHLHAGHKFLLETALSVSNKVVIGLTTDILLKNKKYSEKIEDYNTRKQNLEDFIREITDIDRVEIVELKDRYGPPIHEPEYEGIVASQETYPGALKINDIRESKDFKPLVIVIIPLIKDRENKRISSTRIREKLI